MPIVPPKDTQQLQNRIPESLMNPLSFTEDLQLKLSHQFLGRFFIFYFVPTVLPFTKAPTAPFVPLEEHKDEPARII